MGSIIDILIHNQQRTCDNICGKGSRIIRGEGFRQSEGVRVYFAGGGVLLYSYLTILMFLG